MICFLLMCRALCAAGLTTADVRRYLTDGKPQHCYGSAKTLIDEQGQLDADPELFYLYGQCAYDLAKYEEAVPPLTRFLRTAGSAEK
jgi:hypothetical protein